MADTPMTPTTLAAALLKDVPRYGTDPDNCDGFIPTPDGAWLDRDEVLAALTAALDPAIAEQAGEALEGVVWVIFDTAPNVNAPVGVSETNPGTMLDRYEAARYVRAALITALLAQSAALRAERDEAMMDAGYLRTQKAAISAYWEQEQARAEAAEAERDNLSDKLELERALTDGAHRRATAAEAQIAALTARVEGLTGALDKARTQDRDPDYVHDEE